jgi:hypothetical protein
MQKSSEVPLRRKNESIQRRTFEKWRELKKKITKNLHHLEDPEHRIRHQKCRELKKNITEELHH